MEELKVVKIRVSPEAKERGLLIPEKIEQGDWLDLRAAEDVELDILEYKAISLGISMQLPEGYEAHVVPRSSTFKRNGIIMANEIGIIDNSYCGNDDIWHFPAICLCKDGSKIKFNDRICQFRIVKKQEDIAFECVEDLGNENRGGFGSTGIN